MSFEIENGVLKKYKDEKGIFEVTVPEGVTKIDYHAFLYSNIRHVTLPESLINIGESAFLGCFHLKQITIPQNVKHIGNSAFLGCGLTEITIPKGTETIDELAFNGCMYLEEACIPSTVTYIGAYAFGDCERLASISVSPENPCYQSEGGVLYEKGGAVLVQCPAGVSEVTVRRDIAHVMEYAFSGCDHLETLLIQVPNIQQPMILPAQKLFNCPDLRRPMFRISDLTAILKGDYNTIKDTSVRYQVIVYDYLNGLCEQTVLKKRFSNIMKTLISQEKTEQIYAILQHEGLFTAKNIDSLTDYANQNGKLEIQLMLLNHKHEHIGYDMKHLFKL